MHDAANCVGMDTHAANDLADVFLGDLELQDAAVSALNFVDHHLIGMIHHRFGDGLYQFANSQYFCCHRVLLRR